MDCATYGFTVEWYDKQADLLREYQLTLFEPVQGDVEVSMYDHKTHRAFLKRMEIPGLALRDFHAGSTITVHARQLKVKAYADERTRQAVEALHQSVCVLTKPNMFSKLGMLLEDAENKGLRLKRFRLVNESGPVAALELGGPGTAAKWDAIVRSVPEGCVQTVDREVLDGYWDASRFPCTAAFDNCTLGIVRPHAVKDGGVGVALASVMQAGLELSAAEMVSLNRTQAAELLDVYKGVLNYHSDLVDCMCSGPCLAMEIRAEDGVVEKARELAGPHDVDMAKYLRPSSLRARLGKDNSSNGVHVTDLDEDGEREVSYVFDTLLSRGAAVK